MATGGVLPERAPRALVSPAVIEPFRCGCAITVSTLTGQVTSVGQCPEHWPLRHEDKTLRQMADELRVLLAGTELSRKPPAIARAS